MDRPPAAVTRPGAARSALVTASVALAIAGCASEREAATAPAPALGGAADGAPAASVSGVEVGSVAVVGDSISEGAIAELQLGLAALGLEDVRIDARSGRRMAVDGAGGSGVDAVAELAADPPDLWVVALGTNDVANDDVDGYAESIRAVLDALPPGAPVVWVDTYLEGLADRSAVFNEVLRQSLATRGQATVVDWATTAAEDGVLRDGVHPSGFGVERFASAVVGAVDAWMS